MRSLSLQKKFMLIVGGTIALMLFITAIIVVNYIGNSAREKVEQDVANLVEIEAHAVERFFALYGGVAKTFLNSPFVLDFFHDHTDRGNSEQALLKNGDIYQLFKNISDKDDIIKSAFFGSALTGEYFYEPGRVGVDTEGPDAGDPSKGYFTYKRGWFSTAVETGKLYVTPPAVDSQDGSVSAVVQTPVTHKGKLIGVGGVDILISTVGDVIDKINYKGHGTAFLIDDNQNIVYFPDQGVKLELSSPISAFDSVFKDSEGFAQMTADIKRHGQGMTPVTWRGESYIAVFKHARLEEPMMDWTLGILIPESLVTDPISDASTSAALVSLAIILVVVVIMYFTGARITQPILRMKNAMAEIASGDGDLTKRLEIDNDDEIGQLAAEFNRFTDKLRELLKETATHTLSVADTAASFKRASEQTSSHVKQQRAQIDNVSTAVTEMAATVVEISENASQSSDAATQADTLVTQGSDQANQAMTDIRQLAEDISKGVEVVSGLSKESDNIGAVIDVINGIAEQTNLLALNAAIEAARAGEQGRGFAVVADEVRSLASRTQDSTDDIRKMVERLQAMAEQTDKVMATGREQSLKGVERTEQVVASLEQINHAISQVQVQSEHIARATEQQTIVAEDINQSLVTITGLSETTNEHADELAIGATQLSGVSNELKQLVSQFKV